MGTDVLGSTTLPFGNAESTAKREFVDAARFQELAISNRLLLRSDDAAQEIRGLHDPATGVTYVIAEQTLFGEPSR